MQVYIVESEYDQLPVRDVPELPFQVARNPLYIGVKDQQVNRMTQKINLEKLGGDSMGFWDILTKKGNIKWDVLRTHDVIFIASPSRCHESMRDKYSELVQVLQTNL